MTKQLSLTLFGAPALTYHAQSLTGLLNGKALALFIYLAVTGRVQARDLLADLLWSELSNQQARNNLRYILPELRKVVDEYLLITPQTIGFNQQAFYWMDVEILRKTLMMPPESVSTQELQAALDLYRGEFLAGFTVRNAPVFDEWVGRQRETLHTLVLQGFYRLAERYSAQGDSQAALAMTQRLLHWEPWHEAGHRLQMHLLATTGQRAAALTQYILCRAVLADELGAEPEAATTLLYEQIRSGDYGQVTRWPGDRSLKAHPGSAASYPRIPVSPMHNLPGQLTPLIGREPEIADLCALLLSPDRRLVTLVGEGGIGKTRLALAVAQSIADFELGMRDVEPTAQVNQKSKIKNQKFPSGVWFVPLAGLTADVDLPDKLATAVANALSFPLSGQMAVAKQVAVYLAHKRLLLIIDNCEHLLPEVTDFLLDLLHNCPHLSVLVTSRHALRVQAEYLWRLEGLSAPPPSAATNLTPGDLMHYSSVALFVERVQRAHHTFQLDATNQSAVVAICRLVAGLPLGIELAAAQIRHYTCLQLYQTLQRSYQLLATTLRDLPERHRSIKAVLDDSWRLLSHEEANILQSCSVFHGNFSFNAAAAVTAASWEGLLRLVDHSLLLQVQDETRGSCFVLHELVRQYAAEKLAQAPAVQQASMMRHAIYYLGLLHGLEATLLVEFDAQQTIQREVDNVRAAWLWSAAHGDLGLLAKGLESLQRFYRLAGMYREAIHLLEMALVAVRQAVATDPAVSQPLSLLARVLCATAQFYRRAGGVEISERLAAEALALGQRLADAELQGLAYHELARLAQVRGDFTTMRILAEQGCAWARQTSCSNLQAESLNDLGVAVSLCAAPLAATPYFHEALHYLQQAPNHYLEAHVVTNLGYIHLFSHEYQPACRYLPQALIWKQMLSDREGVVTTQLLLGDLWTVLGAYAEARQEYEQALAIVQTMHVPYWESWLRASYGRWQHLCGEPAAAYTTLMLAQRIAQQGESQLHEQWVRIYLGHVLADLGNRVMASQYYQQAIDVQKQANWSYHTADAHSGLAALLLAQNAVAAALFHAETALDLLAEQGIIASGEPLRVYWTCVRVFTAVGDPRAEEILRTAYHTLQDIARKLEDEALRHSFLAHVVVNRTLIAAAQAAGLPSVTA